MGASLGGKSQCSVDLKFRVEEDDIIHGTVPIGMQAMAPANPGDSLNIDMQAMAPAYPCTSSIIDMQAVARANPGDGSIISASEKKVAMSYDSDPSADGVALEKGGAWMYADAKILPLPGMGALARMDPLRWERTPCLVDLAARFEEMAAKTAPEGARPVRLCFSRRESIKNVEEVFCSPAAAARWIRACQESRLLIRVR